MKYTKEQLHELSNFEINEILATLSCKELVCYAVEPHDDKGSLGATVYVDGEYVDRIINYCSNWNDIMPLAVGNNLAIMPLYLPEITVWQATSMKANKAWRDTKMQRAIACCLILVLQGE